MQETTSHVIFAYGFDGLGGGTPLSGTDVAEQIKGRHLAWVHMDATHPDTRQWLHQELSYLDPFIVEALLAEETRPRITEIGEGALIILRGVNFNENAAPEDMVSLRLWIDQHRIISLRLRKLKTAQDLGEKLKAGRGPKNAGEFISTLIASLTGSMDSTLTGLGDRMDEAEEQITENPDASLRESIVMVRKQAIIFRRHLSPQREVIVQLRATDLEWLSRTDKRNLQESYNVISRYLEDMDTIRERAHIIKDELTNTLSEKLNKNMYMISIVTALFLPLGFITGLLGINVAGMPGANAPSAFWLVCGLLAGTGTIQLLILRRLRWI